MLNNKIIVDNIVYVDMDDTICDYKAQYLKYREMYPNNRFPQSIYKFFETIPPIENAIESLKILSTKYDVWILTRPSVINPLCYIEKRIWIENNLGIDWCEKLIISPNKNLLMGKYLIDDVKWDFPYGEQIHYGTELYPNWDIVLKHLM